MRASHYQQWRVLLSYISFALRNLKDWKVKCYFSRVKLEPWREEYQCCGAGEEKRRSTQGDSLDGLLDKSLQKVDKIKIGALMWTWCAIMNMYSY